MGRRRVGLFFLSFLLAVQVLGSAGAARAAGDAGQNTDLAEITKDAYIYVLPLDIMYRTRYQALFNPRNFYRGKINEFRHGRKLAGPYSKAVTAPNNDTIYSSAWLDLALEPLVLHVPDTAGRYYSVQFMDFYTNNFAVIGRRATGTQAGDFMIAGPGYQGEPPAGLTVIASPTNWVWVLIRILIDGPEDLDTVYALQNQFRLTPLSTFRDGKPTAQAGSARTWPRLDYQDPTSYFTTANLSLTDNPPPAGENALMEQFQKIGVGPGQTFDLNRFSEAEREQILLGMRLGRQSLRVPASKQRLALSRTGWRVPPDSLGRYGSDYLLRARVAVGGLGALPREEATYFSANVDADGQRLDGRNHYVLRFGKGELPPVEAFWSLTMYKTEPDGRSFLVENAIHRYSVGDRTKGLKYGPDGSLSIYIQHESPGPDKESNWLPAPDTVFRLSLRMYQPRPEVLAGKYTAPPVQRAE